MVNMTFDDVLEHALRLSAEERDRLLQRLAENRGALDTQLTEVNPVDDEPPLTPEEIERLLNQGPKTGAEIAASDAVGGWKHLGITDGAEWVNEQKRKRLERRKW